MQSGPRDNRVPRWSMVFVVTVLVKDTIAVAKTSDS